MGKEKQNEKQLKDIFSIFFDNIKLFYLIIRFYTFPIIIICEKFYPHYEERKLLFHSSASLPPFDCLSVYRAHINIECFSLPVNRSISHVDGDYLIWWNEGIFIAHLRI